MAIKSNASFLLLWRPHRNMITHILRSATWKEKERSKETWGRETPLANQLFGPIGCVPPRKLTWTLGSRGRSPFFCLRKQKHSICWILCTDDCIHPWVAYCFCFLSTRLMNETTSRRRNVRICMHWHTERKHVRFTIQFATPTSSCLFISTWWVVSLLFHAVRWLHQGSVYQMSCQWQCFIVTQQGVFVRNCIRLYWEWMRCQITTWEFFLSGVFLGLKDE